MENSFLKDVLNQPEAMRKALRFYAEYDSMLDTLRGRRPQQVLFCGMGSSHSCSQSAVIRLNEAGIPARMEPASEILHYELPAVTPGTLLVLTSQSGESGEIVDLIHRLPEALFVVGITNAPDSTLGRRANLMLEMHVENELSVSTRTYLASLILQDMLVTALLGQQQDHSQFDLALDVLEKVLARHQEITQGIHQALCVPESLCCLGRGYARATAHSGALFIRETAKCPAMSFDSGEFRHGPFEMVDEHFCAMVFAPGGVSYDMQLHLAQDIAAHRGHVVFVTDQPFDFQNDLIYSVVHDALPERFASIVEVAVPQFFANDAALSRGFAPGVFRQCSKITVVQ